MKLPSEAKSNPKAVWKYMNYKTKNQEGISDLNIDPNDPKCRHILIGKRRMSYNAFFKCFCYRARW